jgi:hypothetical protein
MSRRARWLAVAVATIAVACVGLPIWLSRERAAARSRVFEIAARVGPRDGAALSEAELEQFARDVGQLDFAEVIEAMGLLQGPPGEVYVTPTIPLGTPIVEPFEAWMDPARLLALRLLEIDPCRASRLVQRNAVGWGGGVSVGR